MADNLSALITDAFTIYSEAYSKIAELGAEVADLAGKPRQPKKINQLIEATRLYRVISPSINLNSGETAIEGVTGDIQTINNLLLKLKRSVKLYDVPVFPTPLTSFVINLASSGGAGVSASYITVSAEAGLPQSRRFAIGAGLALTDGGPLGQLTLVNTEALTSLQVDTTAAPIVLNLGGFIERLFYGSANITGVKTWSLSNSSNAKRFQVLFTISGMTPGASTHDQTWPAGFESSDGRWLPGRIFRPVEDGKYEAIATTYDGVTWTIMFSDRIS